MSAILAVQQAIYQRLAADATLPTLSLSIDPRTNALTTVGVYNDVPEGATYPHVLISRAREQGSHCFGGASVGLGWQVTVPLFTMSRYQGDLEALQIHNRVVSLLNFYPLTVTGYAYVSVEYAPGGDATGQLVVRDIEKIETRSIEAEFRVMVKQ